MAAQGRRISEGDLSDHVGNWLMESFSVPEGLSKG